MSFGSSPTTDINTQIFLCTLIRRIDLLHLRENSVFYGSSKITTPQWLRHLGLRHRCHSKKEKAFWNIRDGFFQFRFSNFEIFWRKNSLVWQNYYSSVNIRREVTARLSFETLMCPLQQYEPFYFRFSNYMNNYWFYNKIKLKITIFWWFFQNLQKFKNINN